MQGKFGSDSSEEAKAITRTRWNRCSAKDGPHRKGSGALSHRRMTGKGRAKWRGDKGVQSLGSSPATDDQSG